MHEDEPGDALVLTKAIGTGAISTAITGLFAQVERFKRVFFADVPKTRNPFPTRANPENSALRATSAITRAS